MRTIIPYSNLKKGSWAEDFTPSKEVRQKNMFVQCMGHYKALPGYGVFDRSHLNSFLLLYTISGTGCVSYMGKEIILHPGCATLIDCTLPHSYYCSPDDIWEFRWIHFSGACIDGYVSDFLANWGEAPLTTGTRFFKEVYDLAACNDPISFIECSTMLMDLCSKMLIHVIRNNEASSKPISPVVSSAIEIFEEEFQSDLDLSVICARLSVSKFYFLRTFKQQTGFTPNDYLITVRLNHAKSLLRSTSMTIEDIALECGFSTASYFIRVFKKHEAVTPLHYRKYFLQSLAE
ncbi:MAG: AraC family transcriptional regulator [Lachnospiraceae bacterium]|nr:AraC family transcriptional regulator [Lachnospiraceae bacterium]